MKSTKQCLVYSGNISRLTKANSCIINGRIIVILKKDYEGKACNVYVAYDYKTKKQLLFSFNKDDLISKLKALGERFNEIDN